MTREGGSAESEVNSLLQNSFTVLKARVPNNGDDKQAEAAREKEGEEARGSEEGREKEETIEPNVNAKEVEEESERKEEGREDDAEEER